MEAESETTSHGASWSLSHDTALCLIPPQNLWPAINRLRSLNDKAYGKWPPHINLVYPFVHPSALPAAADILSQLDLSEYNGSRIIVDGADAFVHNKYNTLYLKPQVGSEHDIPALVNTLRRTFGWEPQPTFQPHLTVGQSEDPESDTHKFLLKKARLLTPVSWDLAQLAIMRREDEAGESDGMRRMQVWKVMDLGSNALSGITLPQDEPLVTEKNDPSKPPKAREQISYQYNAQERQWQSLNPSSIQQADEPIYRLIVASYNVLAEFFWPPDTSRNPSLVANLLSRRAEADILLLQEVSDSFLPYLLADRDICQKYPYCTQGSPNQPEMGPLPSLLNIVILSKYPVTWEFLPLQRRHKGAVIATFPTICFQDPTSGSSTKPLVVAGCHLTQGLVDGAVSAKKIELLRLVKHISEEYDGQPTVVAGDFNITTSSYTIDLAQKRGALSSHGKQCIDDISDILAEADFQDAWLATRLESGESSQEASHDGIMDLYEGEQGATFDPLTNALAKKLVGAGFNNRPQRYDRILSNSKLPLRPVGFNQFGKKGINPKEDGVQYEASDHWGIRCLFAKGPQSEALSSVSSMTKAVELRAAPDHLRDIEQLKEALLSHGCPPTSEDSAQRAESLSLLEQILTGSNEPEQNRHSAGLKVVPVGSYGLGVWMSSSDIDCLCIGTISSKTFFTMTLQRLRRAADQGVRVLRRVNANSGTMLELDVRGIKFDLQYCSSTAIFESFPAIMNLPSSHPAFALPVQTLSKLKPARDLSYLQRSIPDLAKFRVAFLLIKAWAKSRGLYGAKFGLLGGIHITVLLVPICKALAKTSHQVSTADIITTFFHHYAEFDWQTQIVLDPFFHKDLKYHRTAREPLCLLGWHPPALNTAMAASVPTVKCIAAEFAKTSTMLQNEDINWTSVIGSSSLLPHTPGSSGVKDFLHSYKSYIKIDARFWGSSPSYGRKFLGWLESRCVAILVDIDRRVPALLPRLWPGRFIEAECSSSCGPSEERQSFYLIGLSWQDNSGSDLCKSDVRAAEASLHNVLHDFEGRMRSDEKYYDASTCWLSATIAKSSEVSHVVLDPDYLAGEDLFDSGDSDDESDDLEEEDDMEEELLTEYEDVSKPAKRGSKKEKAAKLNVPTTAKPPGMGKFRAATDVMNRLRWDNSMDASDYIVGFEDRFTGAQEKALAQWKTEQTDEEFIPQHRILYFKRKSDGVVVWERKTRVDKIFGSGISSGTG
ncbi:hypothetical protein K4F52_001390 [Lecanicillium sp. MT-2017a]|nr:hypothetical protein K4F52_001390 [Lecanicillium sp. MT-2017a]